tara:strand:- start:154 stop:513 length:360 start_codon:yes stop_codon:yes gene_type:complete
MAVMSLAKARTILESPKEYTAQEVKNAKRKVANPEETIQANKGTLAKKKNDKVMVVSIGIGSMKKSDAKKMAKAKMANGGVAYGKPHMYVGGGDVKMNPGLRALKKASPEAFNKITKNA